MQILCKCDNLCAIGADVHGPCRSVTRVLTMKTHYCTCYYITARQTVIISVKSRSKHALETCKCVFNHYHLTMTILSGSHMYADCATFLKLALQN